ncbi:MAG: type I-B CRISPR-associated endonuclease Cas1b [Thermoplasmatales archaeon]
MSSDYIVVSDGTLRTEENTFRFDSIDGLRRIPAEDVRSINFYSGGSVTTGALKLASEHGVPIHFFGFYGNYIGTFWPNEKLLSGDLTIEQAKLYLDSARRLHLSLLLMNGVLMNMEAFFSRYSIPMDWAKIPDGITNIEQLMLEEARIRKDYYRYLDTLLPEEFSIVERTRRPPRNMGNALLSFGNSRLYAEIVTECHLTSLNPTVSFYHSASDRRFSLALDISEIFKVPFVDRFVLKITKQGVIKPSDQHFSEEGEGILLSDSGRKTFLKEWENWMEFQFYHSRLKRMVTHREVIRLELYKLVKHIYSIEEYNPYVMGRE